MSQVGEVWNERGRRKGWLKKRAREIGEWPKLIQEREQAATDLRQAHPDWSASRCKAAAWDVVLKIHSQLLEGTPVRGAVSTDPYRVLLASVPPDRKSRETDDIRWVYQHLDDEWVAITPDDVPSRGALVMLKVAKDDRHFFLREMFGRLVPNRSQVDSSTENELNAEKSDEELLALLRSVTIKASGSPRPG